MDNISAREFGALEQQVDNLERQVARLETQIGALSTKLDELLALANKGRGAWIAGLTLASLASSAATYFTTHFFNR